MSGYHMTRAWGSDDVRPMDADERQRMLRILRLQAANIDRPDGQSEVLTQLQWRFLQTSSFHNLELLAGVSPRTVEQAIEAVLEGRGGTCHVQATAFLALLRGLGFEAHLVAATISQPSDHMAVLVRGASGDVICDVGNGHPYRRPFCLHGRTTIDHLGWYFVAEGRGERLILRRRLQDGSWKRVYELDPRPRRFSDFRAIIDSHHERAGFGPFLSGLRAVNIQDDVVVTLRDCRYRRYGATGVRERRVANCAAIRRLLSHTFHLNDVPVDRALARLGTRIDAFDRLPARVPQVLISVTTTDRPDNLALLLTTLHAQCTRERAHARMLILENSRRPDSRARNGEVVARARSDANLQVQVIDSGTYGRSIAASREVQRREIRRLVTRRQAIDVVWMLDDDVSFAQLCVRDGVLHRVHEARYFEHITRLWNDHPEMSMAVGGVCGDPPIRPDAVLRTQLFDLLSNLKRMSQLAPTAPYSIPSEKDASGLPDFYYDHSRAGVEHLFTPCFWLPRTRGGSVRDETLAFLRAMPGIFSGKTVTRPLLYHPPASDEHQTIYLLRGGNAVFLDIDAVLRHPYPTVNVGAERTRRADMVGTALLYRAGGTWISRFPCPVLHERALWDPVTLGDRSGELCSDSVLSTMRAEFYGVLLARALMDGCRAHDRFTTLSRAQLTNIAKRRRARICDNLRVAATLSDRAVVALSEAETGWMGGDVEIVGALRNLREVVIRGQALYLGGRISVTRQRWFQRVDDALACERTFEQVMRAVADLREVQ